MAFLFWPDTTEKQAHTNLRKLIYSVRRALPDSAQFLEVTTKSIQWRADAPCTVDVIMFEERLADAHAAQKQADSQSALEAAVEFYAGDLLPGSYDEWLLIEQERLRDLYANALLALIKIHEDKRDYDLALSYAQRLLHQDRLQEATYRLLMRLHLLQDDRAAALHIYHICATVLREELAVEPSASTERLKEGLLRLEGETQVSIPTTGATATIPLVGRNREWLQLRGAWEKAQKGRSSLLLIQGEAGIGKTRLAEELVDYARRQGLIAVHTRAYAAQDSAAYTPLVNLLRSERHFQAVGRLDDTWLTELSRLMPELSRNRPDLPAPLPMSEAWQQRRFQEALARGFLASGQPLLLHFDDLQWCDSESLAWLRFLLGFDHRAKLLVVGTVRDDEIDEMQPVKMLQYELQQRNRSFSIDLQPLGADEAARLAMHVVGHSLTDAAAEKLFAETEGSPLFIVEMLRSEDYATVPVAQDERTVDGKASGKKERRLPPKIQAVIKWRLGQLSLPARQMAAVAAVIGRSFTYELLSSVGGQQPETAVRSLDELWRRRVIREQGESGYDFSHDYIREVAYIENSPIRRRYLHRQVAQTLQEQHAAQLDPISAQIASHYEQAGMMEEARLFFERAGDHATAQYANEEAVTYYGRALALLRHDAYKTQFDLRLKREIIYARTAEMGAWQEELNKLEHTACQLQSEDGSNVWRTIECALRLSVYESQSTHERPIARLEQAILLAQKHKQETQEARAQQIIGSFFFAQAKYDQAEQAQHRAIELANKNELTDIAAKANENLIEVLMFTGARSTTIERAVRKTLAFSQDNGDLLLEASCYNKLGYLPVAQGEGEYEQAREYYVYGLALAQEYGLIQTECLIAGNLGVLFTHTGKYDQAKNSLDQAMQKAKQSGYQYHHGVRLNYLAFMHFNTGDYEKSTGFQLAALDYLKLENRLGWLCKAHSEFGLIAYTLGQFDLALEHLQHAVSITMEIGEDRQRGYTLTRLGRVLTALGLFTEARAAFNMAVKLHRKLEQFNRSIMAVAGLAELSLAQAELIQAQGYAEKVLEHLQTRQLDHTDESLTVYMSAYQVLRAAGDKRAVKMLSKAYNQLKKRAGSLDDEAMQKIFWEAPPHADVLSMCLQTGSEVVVD